MGREDREVPAPRPNKVRDFLPDTQRASDTHALASALASCGASVRGQESNDAYTVKRPSRATPTVGELSRAPSQTAFCYSSVRRRVCVVRAFFGAAWTHPQVQERQRITEFARSASN